MHKNKFTDAELKEIFDAYPKKGEVDPNELFETIGGALKDWYDKEPDKLGNTCAIRLSVALNESGNTIPAISGTFKGKDNKNYFIAVSKITQYLTKKYDAPRTLSNNYKVKNAIIWQSNCGWTDATGHVDIIYRGQAGSHFYDQCGTVKYWH